METVLYGGGYGDGGAHLYLFFLATLGPTCMVISGNKKTSVTLSQQVGILPLCFYPSRVGEDIHKQENSDPTRDFIGEKFMST